MAAKQINIPSLQHLARNWRDEPEKIQRVLVRLADNSPTFNYNSLFSAVSDLLIFRQPFREVEEGIRRGVRREDVRNNFLEVLPLIDRHFSDIEPDYVQTVDMRKYAAGRGLMVPFTPPLLYGVDGNVFFPWFSFWRTNPLVGKRLSLFVTLVEEILFQDPDLEEAKFDILDFSVPKGRKTRSLAVMDVKDIPRLSHHEKVEMLDIFAEGFFRAQAELADKANRKEEVRHHLPDARQQDLFGPETEIW